MSLASSGDTVRTHYTGTLDDRTEFDSSTGRDPLEFPLGGGQVMNLVVTEVEDENITVDANHPLAGQALTFAIELVEIA